jgi:hypothetical protein
MLGVSREPPCSIELRITHIEARSGGCTFPKIGGARSVPQRKSEDDPVFYKRLHNVGRIE